MKITPRVRTNLRAQNIVFVILLLAVLGAIAFLTTRYVWQADWTAGGRNSLTDASRKMLGTLDGAVTITAFARENGKMRDAIRRFIGKYQRVDSGIQLHFVNPDTAPQQVRELGITANGELYVEYHGRGDTVTNLTEAGLTNALLRIAKASNSHIVFVTGHGERSPEGRANYDLGRFGEALARKGFEVSTLTLTEQPRVPPDTTVVVIAGPQTNYLASEVNQLRNYVAGGGNLLWLSDPGSLHGLEPLANMLGIRFLDGTIVDATSQLFGVRDVRWLVLNQYPKSTITQHFTLETLLPGATGIKAESGGKWRVTPFLKSRSLPRSWLESGELSGEIHFDKKSADEPGPLNVGVTLARPLAAIQPASEKGSPARGDQRVVVTGDGDFLANVYLGNGGNLDLGLDILNWLSGNARYIDINVPPAPDRQLALSQIGQALLGVGFLIILPLALLVRGGFVWFRRRRR